MGREMRSIWRWTPCAMRCACGQGAGMRHVLRPAAPASWALPLGHNVRWGTIRDYSTVIRVGSPAVGSPPQNEKAIPGYYVVPVGSRFGFSIRRRRPPVPSDIRKVKFRIKATARAGFRAFDTAQTFRCVNAISRIYLYQREISLTTHPWKMCTER